MQFVSRLMALSAIFMTTQLFANNNPAAESQQSAKVYQSLVKDLKVFTKTLSRDIPLYSWTSKQSLINNFALPDSDSIEFNHPTFRDYAISNFQEYFNYKPTGFRLAWLGRGLYTFHNPVGSSMHGDALIEVIIPKGSAYLDLRNGDSNFEGLFTNREIKLSNATIKALNKHFSCAKIKRSYYEEIGKFNGVKFYATDKNDFMKCAARAAMLKEAFTELNIAFAAYIWTSSDIKNKHCPNRNAGPAAQILNAGPWMENATINGYISKFSNDFGDDHLQAYKSVHMFTRALYSDSPKWSFFKKMPMPEASIEKIKRKFGCGQYPEDKMIKLRI